MNWTRITWNDCKKAEYLQWPLTQFYIYCICSSTSLYIAIYMDKINWIIYNTIKEVPQESVLLIGKKKKTQSVLDQRGILRCCRWGRSPGHGSWRIRPSQRRSHTRWRTGCGGSLLFLYFLSLETPFILGSVIMSNISKTYLINIVKRWHKHICVTHISFLNSSSQLTWFFFPIYRKNNHVLHGHSIQVVNTKKHIRALYLQELLRVEGLNQNQTASSLRHGVVV